jgi:hypothetical protein
MLRYRCPQCSQLLQAHELRAGKKSVCNSCLTSHIIPADRAMWLNEAGEPLFPRLEPVPEPVDAPDPTASPPAVAEQELVPVAAPVALPNLVVVGVEANSRDPEPRVSEPTESSPTPTQRSPGLVGAGSASTSPVRLSTTPSDGEVGTLEEPVHADTQADIAAALTEALTLRMKPPRQPRRDLRLSTALWMLLTGLGVALLLVSLFSTADYSLWALILGGVQVVLGYLWIVELTAQRETQRGLLCVLPPVTFYYLGQWKYAKLRPLRFVATGAIIAAVAWFVPDIQPTTHAWVSSGSSTSRSEARHSYFTKLDQLRDYRDRKAYDKLIDLLRTLTKTDEILSEDARNREELAAEMKSLCSHADTGVKVAAMAAYARWGGADARQICLDALLKSEDEKLMALQLLPQWKNTDAAPTVATAVAALIVRPGRVTTRATAALEEIGGPAAEGAALDLLFRGKEQAAQLVALDILEKVGSAQAVTSLAGYANTILDQSIKTKTLETIEVIRNRLKKK